jgi:hypothetical protein
MLEAARHRGDHGCAPARRLSDWGAVAREWRARRIIKEANWLIWLHPARRRASHRAQLVAWIRSMACLHRVHETPTHALHHAHLRHDGDTQLMWRTYQRTH